MAIAAALPAPWDIFGFLARAIASEASGGREIDRPITVLSPSPLATSSSTTSIAAPSPVVLSSASRSVALRSLASLIGSMMQRGANGSASSTRRTISFAGGCSRVSRALARRGFDVSMAAPSAPPSWDAAVPKARIGHGIATSTLSANRASRPGPVAPVATAAASSSASVTMAVSSSPGTRCC